jgi:hypothetical protein
MDELVRTVAPARIACAPGLDEPVLAAARLVAARDGLGFVVEGDGTPTAPPVATRTAAAGAPASATLRRLIGRGRRVFQRIPGGSGGASQGRPVGPGQAAVDERRRAMRERLDALATESARLLVILEHARQRVETAAGPRDVNPYLHPVVEALRGSALDPIEIELRARLGEPVWWERLSAPDGQRLLPWSAVSTEGEHDGGGPGEVPPDPWVDAVRAIATPVLVHGVDLGPRLVERVADVTARTMPRKVRAVHNIRALLRRLRPAGILLADEYHRQDWLAAARAEGVPTAAIQHGMIYERHSGYMHRSRPASLSLPDRTYVFGAWERELLIERSVYAPAEVVVSGSPRLDLMETAPPLDRDALRAELGVRPGDRMVVLSGTHGPAYRQFHIPYALDRLLDRPWPNVHLVVKQHPGEKDRGPYEAVVAGVAAARGFPPPPVTVVRDIDLYRLLRIADAHLGIHSTVLTEAVAAGAHNLLAVTLASGDLLGYVEAGVAVPVHDGASFLAALAVPEAITADARRAFLARHFEAGSASARLRDDLLGWLAP